MAPFPQRKTPIQRLQPMAERIGTDLEAARHLLDTMENADSRPEEIWQAFLALRSMLGQVLESTQELTSALRSREREYGDLLPEN